eukprot:gene12045-13288_t
MNTTTNIIKIEVDDEEDVACEDILHQQETNKQNESFVIEHSETIELPEATRKQMNFVKNQFEAWYESYGTPQKQINELTRPELANVLKKYYMNARKKDGNNYKLCSYLIIKRCLSLIFQHDYGMKTVDIQTDNEFLEANLVYYDMVSTLRGQQKTSTRSSESWQLTPSKLMKLYKEGQLGFYNVPNADILLQTVYFYVCYYTGVGKHTVMKKLEMHDIDKVVENGNVIAYNFHLRKYLPSEKDEGPFKINQIPGKPWCPVRTIQEYLSHRNSIGQSFFQKPIPNCPWDVQMVWYKKYRIKEYFPLNMMCQNAGIDPVLTAGCFNKKRISAEIRFEMTPVYAKLYPDYLRADNCETAVKPGQMKFRKAKRKYGSSRTREALPTIGECINEASKRISNNVQGQVLILANEQANAFQEAPPSSSSIRNIDTNTSQQNLVPNQLGDYQSNGMFCQDSQPSVERAYSCNVSASSVTEAGMTHASSSATASAGSGVLQMDSNRPSMVAHELSNTRPTNTTGQSVMEVHWTNQANKGSRNSTNFLATLRSSSIAGSSGQHSSGGQYQQLDGDQTYPRQTTNQRIPDSPSNTHSGNDQPENSGFRPLKRSQVHQSTPSEEQHSTVQQKRSRFDASNYSFLQNISASAREQGKGAVMLLLRLLDDLSDDNGKELLKDILQEMKVI